MRRAACKTAQSLLLVRRSMRDGCRRLVAGQPPAHCGVWIGVPRRRRAVHFRLEQPRNVRSACSRTFAACVKEQISDIPPDSRIVGPISKTLAMMASAALNIGGDDPMILRRYLEFGDWINIPGAQGTWSPVWRMFRLQYKLDGYTPGPPEPMPWQAAWATPQLVPHYVIVSDVRQMFALLEGSPLLGIRTSNRVLLEAARRASAG